MNKIPVFWVPAPDEDDPDDFDRYIAFRLREEWVAVDNDQLILPVSLLERDGQELEGPQPGILKQYGGEGLLNEMLMSDGDLEKGSEWLVGHMEGRGRYAQPLPSDDDLDDS